MVRSRIRPALVGVLILATIAPAQARSTGTYTGKWEGDTKQGFEISFKVNSSDTITSLKVGYEIQGAGCSATVETSLKKLSSKISNGKFTVKSSSANGGVTVKGKMTSPSKANGSLKATLEDPTGFGCEGDAKTKWDAKG